MKKIAIIDSCDFFATNLKESLDSKLNNGYSTVYIPINTITNNKEISFYDYFICGINNNSDEEFFLISSIKNKYYHANILIVGQNLTLEGIKRLKSVGINTVLLKPVNVNQVMERLKK